MLLWLIAAGTLLTPPARQVAERDPLPPAYAQALASYRDGDLWAAINRLEEIGDTRLEPAGDALWRRGRMAAPQWTGRIRAAIVLLTEAWIQRSHKGRVLQRDPYFVSALTMVRRLVRMAEEGRDGLGEAERRFARDWYLLVVSYRHGLGQVGWSRAFLVEARELFPKDPEVLLVSGSDHERVSDQSKGYMPRVNNRAEAVSEFLINPSQELDHAEGFLRQAAKLAPTLVEARLRLGRVLYRRGQWAEAARELQAALIYTSHDPVRYLALTFLGLVEAARGEPASAERFFADALRVFPGGHIAMVARSEAAYLAGRTSEAAAVILSLLQEPPRDDPWWLYIVGDWWHFEARMTALRAEARR